ncbi:Secondary metabolism regulator LAE1 [Colletotrichum sp. SAR11_240]|nr:Secondary metabolism regulator LAE1 [Colletotrichum sp. SAR11_240]
MCGDNAGVAAAPASQAPAQANNPIELVPEEGADDGASELGQSVASSSTSVTSSILGYRTENGRTYHKYKDGIGRVLDVGTGTGIWAVDFGEDHENAEVLGMDLSPSMPEYVPPNVKFEIDDLEEEWTYSRPFDYIHSRMMNSSIGDWKGYLKKAYDNLTPGGYVELQELDLFPRSDDGTLKDDDPLSKCIKLMYEASVIFGRPYQEIPPLVRVMEDLGYVDVKLNIFKWPSNGWPKDPKYKELGIWNNENFCEGFEGFCMAPFTRAHGWTREEVIVFLATVRKDLRDRSIHAYWPIYSLYGRKPTEEETAN